MPPMFACIKMFAHVIKKVAARQMRKACFILQGQLFSDLWIDRDQ